MKPTQLLHVNIRMVLVSYQRGLRYNQIRLEQDAERDPNLVYRTTFITNMLQSKTCSKNYVLTDAFTAIPRMKRRQNRR